MIKFVAEIQRFERNAEKTGWTYIDISLQQAGKLKPGCKVSFRVKGALDDYAFEKVALLPMGNGGFIMPINGTMRKALGKAKGDKINVVMEADESKLQLSPDLMKCLRDDPDALSFFKSLNKSHQTYFSKWIESAKTTHTKTKRIVMAVTALSQKQGYQEMIRANKNNPVD